MHDFYVSFSSSSSLSSSTSLSVLVVFSYIGIKKKIFGCLCASAVGWLVESFVSCSRQRDAFASVYEMIFGLVYNTHVYE